ncbi:hypothetical protein [Arthrobacter sp. H5]|uniref:hypothetical protein n=1 Tax=Arthrobacter sp. H5 TaxID=1267973 RepID=UPI0004853E74|nr:hypothetical protein [Arthrobacter sp. H5]
MNVNPPRTLEYWLSPQLSLAGHGTPTVLRWMALNDAQRRATFLMMYFWSAWLLLIAVVLLFVEPGTAVYPAIPALVLALGAVLMQRRAARRRMPAYRHPASSRAPRTVTGAWTGVALAGALSCAAVIAFAISDPGSFSPGDLPGVIFVVFLIVSLFMGTLLIPARHIEHSQRRFRARIEREADLRHALEDLAQTYNDPKGPPQFGPL